MTAASPLRVVVGGSAASMNKTITTGLRPKKNKPTALRAREKQPPLVAGATTFPPQAVGQQPVLNIKLLLKEMLFRALLCPRTAGERWCRKAPKGEKPPEAANSPECDSFLCTKPLQPPCGRGKSAPFGGCATTFPPQAVGQQPVLNVE